MRFGILKGGDESESGEEDEATGCAEPQICDDYPKLEKLLGYTFTRREILITALTHRSAHGKGASTRSDYERLEYLGDAVLDLAVAHLLLDGHTKAREGELSKMRAALVNTGSLANIARELELGSYIILSKGEAANGGAERPSILADVFEAVMGAIYREGGYEVALEVTRQLFGKKIKNVTPRDPKTELQEALHAAGQEAPVYLLECVEGPEHAPEFISVVEVSGDIVGRGKGGTKKASQQIAAAEALQKLSDENGKSQVVSEEAPSLKNLETAEDDSASDKVGTDG